MDKFFLIIGASSGIGKEVAEQLVLDGHSVFTASRKDPQIIGSTYLYWDANNPDNEVFNVLPDSLDGIIYCPGTINLKPFNRLKIEDFKNDFQINVIGAIEVIQANLGRIKKSETASVVFFSTVASKIGMGFHTSVATSKSAIEGLTLSLAAELSSFKIRVNCIAPSLTDTPLASSLLSSDEKKESANKKHPLGRYGNKKEIAALATFLLSDNASWMTGQVIHFDGGMSSIKMN